MINRFLFIFLPAWGLLTVAVWFLHQSEIRSEKVLNMAREANHVKFQSKVIASHFQNVLSDLEILSELHELKQLAGGMNDYSREEMESDFLSISLGKGLYDQIRFLDKSGMELMRINYKNGKSEIVPSNKRQNKAERYYFIETAKLSREDVFISPLDLNIENGEVERPIKPMIRMGKPIFDPRGKVRGVLILNYMAEALLKEFKEVAHHSTGEHSLLNADGYWLSGPDSKNEWGFMFAEGKDKTFKNAFPVAWEKINKKETGQFESANDLFTFTTFYPILEARKFHQTQDIPEKNRNAIQHKSSSYKWKIVSHIPSDLVGNAFRKKSTQSLERLLKVYAVLILLTAIGAFTIARTITTRRKTEKELIANEERIRLLLESTGEAMYGTDVEGICTFVNPPCVEILGYGNESDLLGKNMHDLIHHTKANGAPYPMDECRLYRGVWAGVGINVDNEVFWKADNTSFPTEYWSHPIRRDGEIIGTVVTFNDITERKQAEDMIRRSNENYQNLFKYANDGIFIVDKQTLNIIDVNENGAQRLGYTKEELLEMKMSDLYFPEDLMKNSRFNEDLNETGRALFEIAQKRKNGLSLPVEVSSRVIDYEGREVFQNFVRDITERKYAEAKIKEYYEELENRVRERTSEVRKLYEAIEQSSEMVMITDTSGIIEYANPATEKVTGYDKHELFGEKPSKLSSGKQGSSFYKELWSKILQGEIWRGHMINKKKTGEFYYEEMTISPLKNEAGITTHFVAIKRDISERVRAEEALQGAKSEAEKANKAKSVFLSSMSHELRTPLNAILGFTQLIMTDQKKPPSPSQKSSLERILLSGDHLLALINEVLDLSKIEAGRLKITEENFEIGPVIREAIVEIKQLTMKQKVKIHSYKSDKAQFIRADIIRFKQVMLNLISNAVKYNSEGGEVTITSEPTSKGMLRIDVIDTGYGIPKNKFKILFEPFTRLGAEASNIEGTGIGLTITKKLVEALGGKIGLRSVVGEGTRFFVDFPKGEKKRIKARDERGTPDTMGTQKNEGAKTILYVEDDTTNLALVKNILERRQNIAILSATRAKEGIEIAFAKKPDMILLDIDLPDMNGYEVLKRLKSTDATSMIPVVAVSASAMPDDIKKGKSSGFDDYITKPINVGKFLKTIDITLG